MSRGHYQVELISVPIKEKHVLENLTRYYVYEFSRFLPKRITANTEGQFDPLTELNIYWSEPNRHPFFIYANGELAGFSLVESATEEVTNNVDEFFVLRKFEGKGIGSSAAKQLFDRFPGKWTVFQIRNNVPAQAFWRKVIAEYTNDQYSERFDEHRRSIQEFVSPGK